MIIHAIYFVNTCNRSSCERFMYCIFLNLFYLIIFYQIDACHNMENIPVVTSVYSVSLYTFICIVIVILMTSFSPNCYYHNAFLHFT